jgi:nucleotide-binding universal stress UspA family protein
VEKKEPGNKKIILIPTDFSEVSENAINHGIGLAQSLNCKVCLLHVINLQNGGTDIKEDSGANDVNMKLNQYKDHYEKKYPVKIVLLAREGNIFKVINKVAAEIKACLMVMGTHGKQGLQHLYGSYALKVVLDCPCPVIVVQKRMFDKGYRNIVLPVRSEFEAGQSVELILLMHKLFASKIYLMQPMETDPVMIESLKTITRQITGILDEKKVDWEIKIAEATNDFPTEVISHAVAKKSDMIMIISLPGVVATDFSFSSWNERLMFNEAQIPVMCFNAIEPG